MLFPIKKISKIKEEVAEIVKEFFPTHINHKAHTWINDTTPDVKIECSCGLELTITGRDFLSMHNKK